MGTGRMPTTRAGRRDGETAPTRRERTRGRERASMMARASMGTASTDASEASKMELWWRAVKLPMYSVAWVPLLCAAALTYCQHGVVHGAHAMRATLGATLVIAWLNLSNDAFDASTNVDARKPESVVSLTGEDDGGARGGGRVLGERTRAVVASVRGEWELGELEGALGGDRHGVRVPRTAV